MPFFILIWFIVVLGIIASLLSGRRKRRKNPGDASDGWMFGDVNYPENSNPSHHSHHGSSHHYHHHHHHSHDGGGSHHHHSHDSGSSHHGGFDGGGHSGGHH